MQTGAGQHNHQFGRAWYHHPDTAGITRMRRISIAHISDLHFGNHDLAAAEALRIDLRKLAPDFLVVTGDLSQWSRTTELTAAKQFLTSTLQDIRQRKPTCQCLVIPGNHDLGLFKRGKHWHALFPEGPFNPGTPTLPATLRGYYEQHGADERTAALSAQAALSLCEYYPEKEVAFIKLDSNSVSWWPSNYARGKVGKRQLVHLMRVLNDYQSAFADFVLARRIALVHHHVQYLPNAESDRYLLMEDAGVVWHHLLDHGSELILHGHKHFATNMCLRFLRGQEEREVMIVSAGSATSKDQPPGETYSYFHITCDPAQYCLEKRQLSGAHFLTNAQPPLLFSRITIPTPSTDLVIDRDTLKTMLVPNAEDLDTVHRIDRFKCNVAIDLSGNYVADYTYEGVRVASDGDDVFVIPIVAQGLSDPEALRFRVFDGAGGQPVVPHVVAAGRYKFRFVIPTGDFQNGAHGFSIRASFTLPSIMLPERDYDVVGLTRFVHGVEEFEYRLTSQRLIEGAACYSIRKQGLRKLGGVQALPSANAGRFGLVAAMASASEMEFGFMMCYKRLVAD